MDLKFIKADTKKDIKNIFDYNIDAFSDSPDFKWTYEELQNEVSNGWELFSVNLGEEVIAALFFRVDGNILYSKNTAIKMNYQGSGYSHQIKEFFEMKALEHKVKEIFHYCRIDNFRMYSLNESHGYTKTLNKNGEQDLVVEWIKKL
jgi:hypothetical protein